MKKSLLSKQIIQDFFEGKTTRMQNIMVREWLDNPINRELYFQWLEEWESENPQFTPNVDSAYQRSLTIVQEGGGVADCLTPAKNPVSTSVLNALLRFKLAAAASIALCFSAFLLSDFWLYTHYETGYGEIRVVRLADSTRVTLNANSALTVPRFGFGNGTREVRLEGEAEFAVKHTPDHRKFIVRTPDKLEVKVLGTEFIVYSRERGSKVVLSQGSVQLRSLNMMNLKPVLMKPGDIATMSNQGKLTVSHSESLSSHQAWKQQRLMFENTPVSEIAYQISEHFGVNVVVTDSTLARRTLGGTFYASDPLNVLKALCDVLNAQVTRVPQNAGKPETFILNPNH
jgi:ferric-dicitrate binding protein FerR (iron transport regulator)